MDTSRRLQLPALNFLDARTDENPQNRSMESSAPSHPASKASAETPYTYADSASRAAPLLPAGTAGGAWPASNPLFQTPPESRRSSGDEKTGNKAAIRQSLPSLSEIMGGDRSNSFSKNVPPPPGLLSNQIQHSKSTNPSPASPVVPSVTSSSTATYPPYTVPRADSCIKSTFPSIQTHKSAYGSVDEARGTSAVHVVRPGSHLPTLSGPLERSPVHDPVQVPHATHPMPPPGMAYGQPQYPPRRDESHQQPSLGPIYQPSVMHNAPAANLPAWKSENGDYSPMQRHDGHKDTVKRHLDSQHLEYALNEISHTSGILSDFARRYGDQVYANQRTLANLPSIVEVDDMAAKTKVQLDQLLSIRDHVINQQQAIYDYQVADQHASRAGLPEKHRMPAEHSPYDNDDKNSFQGDPKKPRRGRAAPPGRCHSCNRAETPEWRRGPDGARTLCNACGLHYAKLTRKNNNNNNSNNSNSTNKQVAGMVGSNLRPKDPMTQ